MGYQLDASGFMYLILAVIVLVGYCSAQLATGYFPIKAVIMFPLLFYFGYRFADSGNFMFILLGIATFFVYLVVKAIAPDA